MHIPRIVICVLGPSVGFNREVVLLRQYAPGGRAAWVLPAARATAHPDQDAAAYLETAFGLKIQPQDLRGRCDRWTTAMTGAGEVQLYSLLLSGQKFDAHFPCTHEQVQIRSFRDIFHHSPDLDWCTLGMIVHVFYHLER